MAICPKCGTGKLNKRKSDNSYNCPKHGFIRYAILEYVMITKRNKDNDHKRNK